MGFFKRLFSADYRAAVAAEAAGDLDLAAQRYALAGQNDEAVRVHMARAERAPSRNQEIEALRDALHWAEPEGAWRPKVCRALGDALLSKAKAEGVATERDRDRVREAAGLLEQAGEYKSAGEAYESIGEDQLAARAFRSGGLVDKMEFALSKEESQSRRERDQREAFADYELAIKGGDRDGAVASLRRCIDAADNKSEYRRLLDDLESRMITGGRAELRIRRGDRVTVYAGHRLLLGRDPLCDLVLRSGGVSRRHAEIVIGDQEAEGRFMLRDAGSRNGTLLGGMRVSGSVPLSGDGSFALGDECRVDFSAGDELVLRIDEGLDQGTLLVAGTESEPIALGDQLGIEITVFFRDGRPILLQPPEGMYLNGERIAHGDVQIIHGDQVSISGVELEVL